MDRKIKAKMLLFAVVISIVSIVLFSLAEGIQPNGGSTTVVRTETAAADNAGNHSAYAGNVTELIIAGFATTQSWQGYFGNVTGAIELADTSGDVLYNWTLVSPQGEVYSSTNSTITWTNIQCFNFTATGNTSGNNGSAGGTNLAGTNLTILESRFNIATDDVDGVNETFSLKGAFNHSEFFTANLNFTVGECPNTAIFDSSRKSTAGNFEEVLLYEPATSSVVFAALLENNLGGYDTQSYDFETLVLEDGHNTDVSTTAYYFFVEIE